MKVEKRDIFFTGGQDKYRMVFPTPVEEEYYEGQYILKEDYDTAELLAFFQTHKNGNSDIALKQNPALEEEEYTINIDENGICLGYATETGLFRAFTSLRQLIDFGERKEVPFTKIHDKPQFKYRGVMIMAMLGYTPEYLCEIIDFLAGLKYNEIQLYMDTPDCYRFDAFPDLKFENGCLTGKDIESLDQYCKERYIELVPNQNGFGHMRAWLDLEDFKHLEVSDGVTKTNSLNILDPEVLEFIDRIYGSLLPHFSSKRVNIGLDEVFGMGRFQLEQVCREKGKMQVFMDWLNTLSDLCEKKYGKTVMFWADMITEAEEKYFDQIPVNAMPVEWGYEDINAQLVPETCRAIQKCGRDYYVAPSTDTWGTIAGRFETGINNIRTYGEVGQKYGAKGYLLTLWAWTGFVWELVPIALGAQYAWNVGIKQHCGWRKSYFVRNAQTYVDKYVLGNRVSADICKVANTYLLEPERVACGSILRQALSMPLSRHVKPDFYDVTEIYEEYHIQNIISSVQKISDKLAGIDFHVFSKREFIVGAKTIILAAEYMRVRIEGSVTRSKAQEIKALSEWILTEWEALSRENMYENVRNPMVCDLEKRQAELEDFIVD